MPFAIYKLVAFVNRVVGIMFELTTEQLGRKGCIFWSFIIYNACQILGCKRTVTKWVRNVACMEVKVILRFLMENGKERFHSEDLYEYGGDNIEMYFKDSMRMEFDHSCFSCS